MSSFFLSHPLPGRQLPVRALCFPRETQWEGTKFSFVSGSQLGWGRVCPRLLSALELQLGQAQWLMPQHMSSYVHCACSCRGPYFLWCPPPLWYLHSFCLFFLVLPEPLGEEGGWEFGGDILFRAEYSKISHYINVCLWVSDLCFSDDDFR